MTANNPKPDDALVEEGSQLLQDYMEQHHGVSLTASLWDDVFRQAILPIIDRERQAAFRAGIEAAVSALTDVRAKNAADFTVEGTTFEAIDHAILACIRAIEAIDTTEVKP